MLKHISTTATVLCLVAAGDARARTWTDASGMRQVDAEFIMAQFDKIWLRRSDGQVFGIALTELSKVDQDYIRELIQQRDGNTDNTTQNPPGRIPYGPGRVLCKLSNEQIDESSGLACSRQQPGFFWTHNDSGDKARIYLLDTVGRNLGSCHLDNVIAFDFEDMFSFRADNKNYLVLGDVGNNGRAAPVQLLYVIEEPPFDSKQGLEVDQVSVVETIYYSYEDDHRDCEAVGVDPTDKTILMVTKERGETCYAYALRWPEPNLTKAFTARRIATLRIPTATAMDVSPDGRRAVVLTYGNAYEYVRGQDEDWSAAFARAPRQIIVPERVQGESICYGPDGETLYLTSEKLPTPLIIVPAMRIRFDNWP